jgi:tripartite-type tricarboxylate transporter receptor subunit TctC
MNRCAQYLLCTFFLLSVLFSPQGLAAAPYYQGKRITIVVGFAPGGGYDRMTRMIVRHLPKYIPGKPTFIVENMPGGSSMIAANHVYSVAKPDGLTIGNINRGLQIAQLMKIEEMRFDLRKFAWIGSTASDANVLCVRSELPFKTFDDLRKANRQIFMSSGGPMTSSSQFTALIKEYLKINLQDITYTNMADALLSIERKEVDGTGSTYSSLAPLIERGALRPLLRGRNYEPAIKHLPVDEDLTTDKIGKKIMAMRSASDKVGKPYVAPPGTPKEIINILRDAFAKVAKDPQLQADAKKNLMPVEYLSAEESLKAINYLLDQPEDVVNEFKKYIKY